MRKLMKKLKEKKGFTLIEMIIVIAIIAILIALIAPNLQKYLNTAKETTANAAAKTVYTSANSYLVELYTEGTIVEDGTWTEETASDLATEFKSDYLNESEIEGDHYWIIINDSIVEAVKYQEGDFTGYYPDEETYNAASGEVSTNNDSTNND